MISCMHTALVLPHTQQRLSSKLGVCNSEPLTPEAANPTLSLSLSLWVCACMHFCIRTDSMHSQAWKQNPMLHTQTDTRKPHLRQKPAAGSNGAVLLRILDWLDLNGQQCEEMHKTSWEYLDRVRSRRQSTQPRSVGAFFMSWHRVTVDLIFQI